MCTPWYRGMSLGCVHPSSGSLAFASLALVQTWGGFQSSVITRRILTAWDPNLSVGLFARGFLEALFLEGAYPGPVIYFLNIYLCFNRLILCAFLKNLYLKLPLQFGLLNPAPLLRTHQPGGHCSAEVQGHSGLTMSDEGLKGTGFLMTLAVPSGSVSGNGKVMQGCQVPALLGPLPSFKHSLGTCPFSYWFLTCRCDQAGSFDAGAWIGFSAQSGLISQ